MQASAVTVLPLSVGGSVAGLAVVATGTPVGASELGAFMTAAASLAAFLAVRARIRRGMEAVGKASVAAAAAVACFFAVPLAQAAASDALEPAEATTLLGGAPIAAGVIAALGAMYLNRQIRRERTRRIR